MAKKKNDKYDDKKKNLDKTSSNNKKLEHTTRIRVDSKRINDLDSLDTSFLEGRLAKKTKNNRKAKEMILNEKRQVIDHLDILKKILFSLSLLSVLILSILYFVNHQELFIKKNSNKKEKVIDKIDDQSNFVLDKNYIFVGDFSLKKIDYDSFSVPTIVKVDDDYQTKDILDHMNDFIYRYNPSFVYIGIGMNDLEEEIEITEISSNIEKIVKSIKENRPLAKIMIQTVYPINEEMKTDVFSHVTVDSINELNKEIKKIVENEDILIIDMYQILSFKDVLRKKYSEDGVHLNDLGYSIISEKIKKVVVDNEKKEIKKDKN